MLLDRGLHDCNSVHSSRPQTSRASRNLSLNSSVRLEMPAGMVIDTIFCAAPAMGVSVRTALFSFEGSTLIAGDGEIDP